MLFVPHANLTEKVGAALQRAKDVLEHLQDRVYAQVGDLMVALDKTKPETEYGPGVTPIRDANGFVTELRVETGGDQSEP